MNIPPPSQRQAGLIWFSAASLAVAILAGLTILLIWALGIVINKLTALLLPLALAGIIAYLLDPVVCFFIRKGFSRLKAIVAVFALAVCIGVGLAATVVPRLVVEAGQAIDKAPDYYKALSKRVTDWVAASPWTKDVARPQAGASADPGNAAAASSVMGWLSDVFPTVGEWLMAKAGSLKTLAGLLFGLFLVPVYVFYFLLERDAIVAGWRGFLPITNPRVKEETVFIISSINDSLIVFFRGQVLVSMCSGTLLAISFFCLGMNYSLFLGAMAGVLGIIPYLGTAISIVPAVTIAAVQFQDWTHPLLVVGAFVVVNLLESLVVSPKIIGGRVGLHPLAIMIAIMTGSALFGGILGGLLAIPMTAALRSILRRYVWKSGNAV